VCLGVSLSERSERSRGLSYIYKKERQLAAQYRAGAVYICVVYTYMRGVFIYSNRAKQDKTKTKRGTITYRLLPVAGSVWDEGAGLESPDWSREVQREDRVYDSVQCACLSFGVRLYEIMSSIFPREVH